MAAPTRAVPPATKAGGFLSSLFGGGSSSATRPTGGKTKLPEGLTEQQIKAKFRDKKINVNVNAMVHLYTGTRTLEYLVDKRVINSFDGSTKIQEAQEIIRANNSFLDKLTRAHEAGRTVDLSEFHQEIQEHTRTTVEKLMAILMTGDKRLGSAESELASTVAYPLKVIIALVIDDLMKLFGKDNKIKAKCDEYITGAKGVEESEIFEDFMNFLRAGLGRGNGTRTHKFLRIAVVSFGMLSRDGDGIDGIQLRVKSSIDEHGTLQNDALDLSDLPDFKETYENLNAMFNNEELNLVRHGGSLCVVACSALRLIIDYLELTPPLMHALDAVIADVQELRGSPTDEQGLSEDEIIKRFLERLHSEIQGYIKGFANGGDGRKPEERARALRLTLTYAARILTALMESPEIVNQGNMVLEMGRVRNDMSSSINDDALQDLELKEALQPGSVTPEEFAKARSYQQTSRKLPAELQEQIRIFAHQIREMLAEITTTGSVLVSDREIPPTDSRFPYFQDLTNVLATQKKYVLDNMQKTMSPTLFNRGGASASSLASSTPLPESDIKAVDKIFEMAVKLVLFHNNAIFLRLQG